MFDFILVLVVSIVLAVVFYYHLKVSDTVNNIEALLKQFFEKEYDNAYDKFIKSPKETIDLDAEMLKKYVDEKVTLEQPKTEEDHAVS